MATLVFDEERGIISIYDASNELVVDLNAETLSHLLVGTFKNALSGTRMEIMSGFLNEIRGYVDGADEPGRLTTSWSDFVSLGAIRLYAPRDTGMTEAAFHVMSQSGVGASASFAVDEIYLASGYQAKGFCTAQLPAAAVTAAGAAAAGPATYGGVSQLRNVPSSITFTTVGTDSNVASVSANDIGLRGFRFAVTSAAAGLLRATRTFVTVGN